MIDRAGPEDRRQKHFLAAERADNPLADAAALALLLDEVEVGMARADFSRTNIESLSAKSRSTSSRNGDFTENVPLPIGPTLASRHPTETNQSVTKS
jgi:hypothetical protein